MATDEELDVAVDRIVRAIRGRQTLRVLGWTALAMNLAGMGVNLYSMYFRTSVIAQDACTYCAQKTAGIVREECERTAYGIGDVDGGEQE